MRVLGSMRRKRRQDLSADFAVRMILRDDVDVPFTLRELPGLIGRQRRLPVDRAFERAALFDQREPNGSILARLRGAVELNRGHWT